MARRSWPLSGELNRATRVPVTADSLFQVGSITKLWTATMIMQLVDERQLSLDTTAAEVLPGTRLGAGDLGGQVTVRHLLTHTSGIDGDVFTDTGRGDECVERYVGLLAEVPSLFTPGATYSYCNSGFVVLGRIIEVLDGQSWDESLRQRLVGPLGITRTVTLPEEAILYRAAVGHRRGGTPVDVWNLPRGVGPAGLIIAAAGDLLTFARLHLDGGVTAEGKRVISEASVTAMQAAGAVIPEFSAPGSAVGLGWRLSRWGDRTIIGHDGDTIGQSAYLRIDPKAGIAACLLTNATESEALYREVFNEVFGSLAGRDDAPGTAPRGVRAACGRGSGSPAARRPLRARIAAVRRVGPRRAAPDGADHDREPGGADRLRARGPAPAPGGLLGHPVRGAVARRRALGAAELRPARRRHAVPLHGEPGNAKDRVNRYRTGCGGYAASLG